MPAPQQVASRLRQYQQLAQVPPDIRSLIADDAIKSQKSVLAFPYYSTVRIQTTRTGSTAFTYAYAGGTVKAFTYAQGDTMSAAGFPTTTVGTQAETNLLQASQTRDNSDVMIWGLAAYLTPDSDPEIARWVWRNSGIFLSLSGTDTFQVGRLEMLPSAGGLYGSGVSLLTDPPLGQSRDNAEGFVNNGNPMAGNFLRFPNAVRWNANGSGKKDTTLQIQLQTNAFTVTPTPTTRAAATGVAAYTAPSGTAGTPGTYCDIVFRLVSVSISERSENT